MKQYIVNVLIGLQSVKKFVVNSFDIAETIADNFRDEVTDAVISEVTYNQ